MIADPGGLLALATRGKPTDIYRLGFGITDFHICRLCGVFVAATWSDQNEAILGVVNVRALDDAEQFIKAPTKANFENEDITEREARRRSNWTPAIMPESLIVDTTTVRL
jgi:hypothetical protein